MLSQIPNPQTPNTPASQAAVIPEPGDPAIDALMKQSIEDIEKEFAYQEPVDEVSATQDAPDVVAATEKPAEPSPGVPAAEKQKEPTEAGLERLVAREVEIRTREAAIQAREAAVKAAEGRQDPTVAALLQGMRTDPEAALKAAGVNVDHAMRLIIAKRLGDKAPAELRTAIRDAEIEQELQQLRSHNAQMQTQAQAAAFYQKTVSDVRQYVTTGISKDVPALAEIAAESPDWVHEMVVEEITRDAQNRLASKDRSAGDTLLAFPDAAKRVEKRLAPVLARTSKQPVTSTADAKISTKPAETSNSKPVTPPGNQSNQSNPKPTQATKPLRPWEARDDQELLDAGIREALLEYRRAGSNR